MSESRNAGREGLGYKLLKVLQSIMGRFFSSWVQTKDGSFLLGIGVVVKFWQTKPSLGSVIGEVLVAYFFFWFLSLIEWSTKWYSSSLKY